MPNPISPSLLSCRVPEPIATTLFSKLLPKQGSQQHILAELITTFHNELLKLGPKPFSNGDNLLLAKSIIRRLALPPIDRHDSKRDVGGDTEEIHPKSPTRPSKPGGKKS